MLKKNKKGVFVFHQLEKRGIKNAFSVLSMGSMQKTSNKSVWDIEQLAKMLDISPLDIVGMKQTHGDNISIVSTKDKGKIIEQSDALFTKESCTYLYGTFADCVPIFFVEPDLGIIAIAHSGWRGVYANIAGKMCRKMIHEGANASKMLVFLGPSIRSCCYTIDEALSDKFKMKYTKYTKFIHHRDSDIYLDLQRLVTSQLCTEGILKQNIFDAQLCTKDHSFEFFSYRNRGKNHTDGVFAGVIGRI